MASIIDDLRGFRRSWVHHTGMQLATLTVLAATFAVVGFVFISSLNLNRLLVSWGESVEMSVYLKEAVTPQQVERLTGQLNEMSELKNIRFIGREQATENFKRQMASYAPGLLNDPDFANPFPSSFRVALKGGVKTNQDVHKMETVATAIGHLDGVDDVSFGQGWVKNYSAFVNAVSASGGVIVLILGFGSLFVVGNSIRVSVSGRRDEVEILELVGATSGMIRRPFVLEGLATGLIAAGLALILNFGIFIWQSSLMNSSLVFSRITNQISFLGFFNCVLFLLAGAAFGGAGAWLAVRQINDGWSASQRAEGA